KVRGSQGKGAAFASRFQFARVTTQREMGAFLSLDCGKQGTQLERLLQGPHAWITSCDGLQMRGGNCRDDYKSQDQDTCEMLSQGTHAQIPAILRDKLLWLMLLRPHPVPRIGHQSSDTYLSRRILLWN